MEATKPKSECYCFGPPVDDCPKHGLTAPQLPVVDIDIDDVKLPEIHDWPEGAPCDFTTNGIWVRCAGWIRIVRVLALGCAEVTDFRAMPNGEPPVWSRLVVGWNLESSNNLGMWETWAYALEDGQRRWRWRWTKTATSTSLS